MELWEFMVGSFLLETRFVWLFYYLMGADLAWSCKVNSFLREFDLITVGSGSSIDCRIRCRKFRAWKEEERPQLVFRPIEIGDFCCVNGMVCPGVTLDGGSHVEKFSSVPEGAQVPVDAIVSGSPAVRTGLVERDSPSPSSRTESLFGLVKFVWLFVELYLYFGLFVVGQVVLNERLPEGFRYSPLLYWVILIPMTSILGLVVSFIMKWILIGRRRPEHKETPIVVVCIGFAIITIPSRASRCTMSAASPVFGTLYFSCMEPILIWPRWSCT